MTSEESSKNDLHSVLQDAHKTELRERELELREREIMLEEPDPRADLDEWFRWQDAMKVNRGITVTLRDIANKVSLNYDYVRKKRSEYDAQHGE